MASFTENTTSISHCRTTAALYMRKNFSRSNYGILIPELTEAGTAPEPFDWQNLRRSLGDEPTASSVLDLIMTRLPLNVKQGTVIEKIISNVFKWQHFPYDDNRREQLLLYVGGEGGVGKSQVIHEISAGMELLNRKQEVILMGFIGVAASNINGNTYYTALGLQIGNQQRNQVSSRIRSLWNKKTIMIIDEISMQLVKVISHLNR